MKGCDRAVSGVVCTGRVQQRDVQARQEEAHAEFAAEGISLRGQGEELRSGGASITGGRWHYETMKTMTMCVFIISIYTW